MRSFYRRAGVAALTALTALTGCASTTTIDTKVTNSIDQSVMEILLRMAAPSERPITTGSTTGYTQDRLDGDLTSYLAEFNGTKWGLRRKDMFRINGEDVEVEKEDNMVKYSTNGRDWTEVESPYNPTGFCLVDLSRVFGEIPEIGLTNETQNIIITSEELMNSYLDISTGKMYDFNELASMRDSLNLEE
ncbi:MAG: hypothetical protein KAQ83_02900 [Nanoarchaeota archaeon]|nr:hypothetical protein [Nanoarchaeota archaeon]